MRCRVLCIRVRVLLLVQDLHIAEPFAGRQCSTQRSISGNRDRAFRAIIGTIGHYKAIFTRNHFQCVACNGGFISINIGQRHHRSVQYAGALGSGNRNRIFGAIQDFLVGINGQIQTIKGILCHRSIAIANRLQAVGIGAFCTRVVLHISQLPELGHAFDQIQ